MVARLVNSFVQSIHMVFVGLFPFSFSWPLRLAQNGRLFFLENFLVWLAIATCKHEHYGSGGSLRNSLICFNESPLSCDCCLLSCFPEDFGVGYFV